MSPNYVPRVETETKVSYDQKWPIIGDIHL